MTVDKWNGRIRDDITQTDIELILSALYGVLETNREATDAGWRRILSVMLAGMRPGSEKL